MHERQREMDVVFTGRQFQEKCQEQNEKAQKLHIAFIDLAKPCDTVVRDGLQKIVTKFGCPSRFIAMVCQFYHQMLAFVKNEGKLF